MMLAGWLLCHVDDSHYVIIRKYIFYVISVFFREEFYLPYVMGRETPISEWGYKNCQFNSM